MASRRIGFLGPFTIDGKDGTELITAPRQQKLFTALAFRPGSIVPHSTLGRDIFCPESPPKDLMATLRTNVDRLRDPADRVDLPILTRSGGYQLDIKPDDVDALVFMRKLDEVKHLAYAEQWKETRHAAAESLDLWRDPVPLIGVPPCPVMKRWLKELEEARLLALHYRIDADIHLGYHREVIPDLVGLTAEHPGNEDLRGLHMRALHLSGRQADAIAVYYDTRDYLDEHFGLPPGEALYNLHQEIIRRPEPHRQTPATRRPEPRS